MQDVNGHALVFERLGKIASGFHRQPLRGVERDIVFFIDACVF